LGAIAIAEQLRCSRRAIYKVINASEQPDAIPRLHRLLRLSA
jgi:hypothetical protein